MPFCYAIRNTAFAQFRVLQFFCVSDSMFLSSYRVLSVVGGVNDPINICRHFGVCKQQCLYELGSTDQKLTELSN